MFSYNISKVADAKAFNQICSTIEFNFKGAEKEKPLIDVDGTTIQIYRIGESKIRAYNDYDVDAVYIDSDVDLSGVL